MDKVKKFPKKYNVPIVHMNLMGTKDSMVGAPPQSKDFPSRGSRMKRAGPSPTLSSTGFIATALNLGIVPRSRKIDYTFFSPL